MTLPLTHDKLSPRERYIVPGVAALALGAVIPALTVADTADTNVAIVANVVANCISTSTPIAFGNYNPFDPQPLMAVGTLTLTCTQEATPSVAIGLGANPSGGVRRMTAPGGGVLPYSILTPTSPGPDATCTGATTDYPTVAPGFTLTPAPSFAPRTFTVCGKIASGISAPIGSYADTVLATISF
jgi:spore coat protein U-like protein